MATYTASANGNWSSSATWGGTDPTTFTTADAIIISAGKTVTLDIHLNGASCSAGVISSDGTLILSAGTTTTLCGALAIGGGTGKDGTLVFGPSSTLALCSSNLILNNCTLSSTSTSTGWATITGTGGWATGGVTGPKNAVNLSYMSIRNTGNIVIGMQTTRGTQTNGCQFSHVVFYGTGLITIGTGNVTPNAANRTFDNCDFVDCVGSSGYILNLKGIADNIITGSYWIKNCTFINTLGTEKYVYQSNRCYGLLLEDSIFSEVVFGYSSAGVPTWIKHCLFTKLLSANESMTALDIAATTSGNCLVADNYFFPRYANPISMNIGYPNSTSTITITGNVTESWGNGHSAFMTSSPFSGAYSINHNAHLGPGQLFGTTSSCSGNVNVSNNTRLWTAGAGGETQGVLWFTHDWGLSGTENVINNVVDYRSAVWYEGTVTSTVGSGLVLCYDDSTRGNQSFSGVGYNVANSVTSAYSGIGTVSNPLSAYDINTSAKYIGISRFGGDTAANDTTFAMWNQLKGSGTKTDAAGVTYLASMNGYDSTTKLQSASTAFPNQVPNLVSWVFDGLSPTNALLRKAGSDGNTIGAMEWQNPRRKRMM